MACTVCKSLGFDGSGHNSRRCPHKLAIHAGHDGGKKPASSKAYAELFAELEPPPEDPLLRPRWAAKIVSAALFATAKGDGDRDLNTQIIGLTKALNSLTPTDRVAEAETIIKRNQAAAKQKARTAPPLETPVAGSKPLR